MNTINNDSLSELFDADIEAMTEDESKRLLMHLRTQFRERYMYLVGEWSNDNRAKSTRNGQFVSNDEVINYLTG